MIRYTVRDILAKTAAYTIKKDQPDKTGRLFTNRGATGSVTITLPAPKVPIAGVWYEFEVIADQSLIVAGASAGQIVTNGNAAADNVGFQVAGQKIGGRIIAICDGTSWLCVASRPGGGFCVNGTEQAPVTGSNLVEGAIKILMGTAVTIPFKPEGLLDSQFSIAGAGNGADATDDTLFTMNLPAGAMDTNGDKIRVRLCGVTAATANNKRIKIFFGATAVVDSGVITSNAKNWWAEVVITRTGAATQIAFGSFGVDAVADVVTKTTPAETLSGAIVVKGTGSSPTTSAAGDVLGHDWHVEAMPL